MVSPRVQLAGIPGLFADPVRSTGDPPLWSTALAQKAASFWRPCTIADVASAIPNTIHQPWLHGTTPKWEHVLGMLAARFIVRPSKYVLYFDKQPEMSPQWRCFCSIADCVRRRPSVSVHGRRIKMGHWPEIMRYDLLLEHGGIFLDHDSYALTPLDDIRKCSCAQDSHDRKPRPAASVIAGFEQDGEYATGSVPCPSNPNAHALASFCRSWGATQ